MNYKGKKVAVLGLGLEGRDLVNYLLKQGARVYLHDVKPEEEIDFEGIDKQKINCFCGKNYLKNLDTYQIIFRSPGVYRYKPELVRAEKRAVKISSAIKLFIEKCPGKIIGVTGTKGKGTTSSLIYQILKSDRREVSLAGNIGKPYLELLPQLRRSSWVILELSSFQLIDLKQSPHVAVVLNVTTDHLDWHKDREEYLKAKMNIVLHQNEEDYSLVNDDYPDSRSFSRLGKGEKYFFSRRKKVKGCYVLGGKIYLETGQERQLVGLTDRLLLRGEHNWENVAAAICAAGLVGAEMDSIKKTVFNFKGLEHRLELAGEVDGVLFYNDSFATGPDPTIAAINSFSEPITLILGGYDKGLDYQELARVLSSARNLRNVILIGDLSEKLECLLKRSGIKASCLNLGKPVMKEIVLKSLERTPRGGVVILSPAAASFDMFKSYKERGSLFKEVVKSLGNGAVKKRGKVKEGD